jgi:Zn-dependent peptidase ImmA (M78 family)
MFDSPDMAIICKRDSIEGRKTNDTNVDSLEWQANYFAGCLLMPEQVVKNLYNLFEELISKHTYKKGFVNELNLVLNDHDLIGFVALRCEVSRQAAEIRLKNLKMLNTRYLRPIDRARVEAISYTNNLKINGF